MGIQTLLGILNACYGGRMNRTETFIHILKKQLPSALTDEQGQLLGERLVSRCKFPPSVAEILEEWNQMKREERRRTAPVLEYRPPSADPAIIGYLKQVQQTLRSRQPVPALSVAPDVWDFVRYFFPDISEPVVQRNVTAILNCRSDRMVQRRERSPYRTVMHLTEDGTIELSVRKYNL